MVGVDVGAVVVTVVGVAEDVDVDPVAVVVDSGEKGEFLTVVGCFSYSYQHAHLG